MGRQDRQDVAAELDLPGRLRVCWRSRKKDASYEENPAFHGESCERGPGGWSQDYVTQSIDATQTIFGSSSHKCAKRGSCLAFALVNGILWTAHREVPEMGAPVAITAKDLELPAKK
jgi:hypothetical protein